MGAAVRPYLIGGIILALIASHAAAWWQSGRSATAKFERRVAEATVKQLEQRGQIDAATAETSIVDICVELGGSVSDCRQ